MSNSLVRYSLFSSAIAGSALVLTSTTLFAIPASAGSATASLNVSATVINNCTITASALEFGNYDPLSANKNTALAFEGSVTTSCTVGTPATIMLSQGQNPAADSTKDSPKRRLKHNNIINAFLSYNIYKNSGRNDVWGDTADTGLGITGAGQDAVDVVYGVIPPGLMTLVGSYSDTVTATVQF